MLKTRYDHERDRYAGSTPASHLALSHRHRRILEIMKKVRPARLLDVGCGDGGFALLLKELVGIESVLGVDVSDQAIIKAQERGLSAFKVDLDRYGIPLVSESVDAVLAGEVIEHVYDPDFLLDEVYRVLASSGTLVLTTPNLAALHNRLALFLGFEPFCMNPSLRRPVGHMLVTRGHHGLVPSGDHIRTMTVRSLRTLLQQHFFEIESIEGSSAVGDKKESSVWYTLQETWPGQFIANRVWKGLELVELVLTQFPTLSFRTVVTATKVDADNKERRKVA